MNFKTNYNNLLEDQLEIIRIQNTLETKTKEFNEKSKQVILSRVETLREVGLSVLDKSFGGLSSQLAKKWFDSRFYGGEFAWLKGHLKPECTINLNSVFIVTQVWGENPIKTSLDLKFVTMSNRDFAKVIRKSIKKFRYEQEVTKQENAGKDLHKAKHELKLAEENVQRLEKLLERKNKSKNEVAS